MANTKALKTEVECYVRNELEKDFPGHTFAEKAMQLRKKRDGTFAIHKFDAVSEDNSIVANIKSHSWKTSGGKNPAGKIASIFQAIHFLGLVRAETRLLILTDKTTYNAFMVESDGKLPEGIETRLYELPAQLQKLVSEVQRKASEEMSAR